LQLFTGVQEMQHNQIRNLLLPALIGLCSLTLVSCVSPRISLQEGTKVSLVTKLNQVNCFVGCISIVVFDVGQGTTNLVVLPNNKIVLIDAGGSGTSNAEGVIKWMDNNLGGMTIDHLILSHSDNDHTNLLNKLSEGNRPKINVNTLSSIHMAGRIKDYASRKEAYKFFAKIVADPLAEGEPRDICTRSRKLVQTVLYCFPPNSFASSRITPGLPYDQQNDFYVTALAVNASEPLVNPLSIPNAENGDSLVVSIKYRGFSAIFGGDMEGVTQDSIQSSLDPSFWRNTSLYVVPHHGSLTKGSNAFGFLSLVAPNIVAVSSSKTKLAGWNHPDGILMKGMLQPNYSGLSNRVNNTSSHLVLAQFQSNLGPIGCACQTQKAIFTTYTTGSLHLVSDGNKYYLNREKNNNSGLNPCGPLICGQ
jgi:beta-lactamase superfamily II metal-dependent hydrolase